jgi:hypothetical protein
MFEPGAHVLLETGDHFDNRMFRLPAETTARTTFYPSSKDVRKYEPLLKDAFVSMVMGELTELIIVDAGEVGRLLK